MSTHPLIVDDEYAAHAPKGIILLQWTLLSPVLVLAGLWVGGLALVGDLRLEAVDVVGGVGDDLRAAVGQRHLVAAPRHVAASLLVLLKVGARPRVSHAVREAVGFLLKEQGYDLSRFLGPRCVLPL